MNKIGGYAEITDFRNLGKFLYAFRYGPKWENRKRGKENSNVVNINKLKLLGNLCSKVGIS